MDPSVKNKIETDPDFIDSRRHGFSLARALENQPDGLPLPAASKALGLTEEEGAAMYNRIVAKLREAVADEDDE